MQALINAIVKQIKLRRYLILLSVILLLALFIRTYHMHTLSVFIADQAIMSTETLKILRGDLTLLGPRTSIAPIYFGPIVFYLMVPFYLIFQGYPLAGTVFQTSLQILILPLVFLIGKKVKNEQVGLIAVFLFAISALFVDYARGSFNTTTALSFSTIIIYLFFSALHHYRFWKVLIIGILLGCMFQMNFLTISLFIAVALFPLLFYRKLLTVSYFGLLIIGFLIGFSPYLLFEFRHDFLNTHEMINYLFRGGSGNKSVLFLLIDVPGIVSHLLYGIENFWLGTVTLLCMILGIGFTIKKKKTNLYFNFLLFLVGIALLLSLVYGRHLLSIYLITIHTSIIVIFATLILFIIRKRYLLWFLLSFILFLNLPHWNLQKPMHDLQDGLLMSDFKKAALIIQNNNSHVKINVAMDAQRDNRAMPLRYFLFLYKIPVLSYEDYGSADELYFIVRKTTYLQNIAIWEYKAFGAKKISNRWDINNQYVMYQMKRP